MSGAPPARYTKRPREAAAGALQGRMAGFTLLEMLVALGIFAVVAALAYGGLRTILASRTEVASSMKRLEAVARAFNTIGRDLDQAIDRPVRDDYGVRQPALFSDVDLSGDGLQFTRAGWDNPLAAPRSDLQRVAYQLRDGGLYRIYWNVLDRAQDSKPQTLHLLQRVDSVRMRYLGQGSDWGPQWPPGLPAQAASVGLPRVVEIELVLPDLGHLTRLYRLPDG